MSTEAPTDPWSVPPYRILAQAFAPVLRDGRLVLEVQLDPRAQGVLTQPENEAKLRDLLGAIVLNAVRAGIREGLVAG